MVEGRVRDSIEDICNITHTQEPQFWRGPGSVHGPINNPLEGLVSLFKHILVLVVRFVTPSNPEEPEIIHDLMAMLILGVVPQ